MKNMILAAALFAVSATSLPAIAAGYADDHRAFYGFYLYNEALPSYGFAKFTFDDTREGELLYDYKQHPGTGMYAGAGVNGLIYGYEYEYVSSMSEPAASNFVSYNIYTGHRQVIGAWSVEQGSNFKPHDMTYDMKNGIMYALGFDYGRTGLYTVDINTGAYTLACNLENGVAIAANAEGVLYMIDNDGFLVTVNPQTGVTRKVAKTGMERFDESQSMTFDFTTGVLFWGCSSVGNTGVALYAIDLNDPANRDIRQNETLAMTLVGVVGREARMRGLYIPFADSLDAPAVATDISGSIPADNPLSVTLKWTNPVTTFSGGELGSLDGVAVRRNGETITVFTDDVLPGQEMSYTDASATEDGEYRYDIIAFNSNGSGEPAAFYQYLGVDRPGQVEAIKVSPATDLLSASLSWQAPSQGYHGGYINPADLRYTVTRLPDNLVLAENIAETTLTDSNFRRLLNYSYEVTATNATGYTSAVSTQHIMGPAVDLPYVMTVEDESAFLNQWTLTDNNNDTYTWMLNTGMGHAIFGDYEPALEYVISPTSVGSDIQNADEWLISPPLALVPGTDYAATFSIRTLNPEDFEILYGPTNSPEGMKKVREFTAKLEIVESAEGNRATFTKWTGNFIAEGEMGCVALRLVTPLEKSQTMSSLQINRMEVGLTSGVDAVAGSDLRVRVVDGMLRIDGDFASAQLYNAAGMKCAAFTEAVNDVSALARGVYLLNVDGRSFKLLLK